MLGSHMLTCLTKYLLCCVSLTLTALFALSFTSAISMETGIKHLPQLLMVAIGVGIDLSKYLFWHYRCHHRAYYALAFVLVLFSCMASIAFFVTQEQQQMRKAVQNTAAFQAQSVSIALLEKEILAKQKLVDARLASRYHDQWDKGERLAGELAALRGTLGQLLNANNDIGVDQARQQISTAAFFLGISNILGTSFASTVTVGYALLALLIELSALGVIALTGGKGGVQTNIEGLKKASPHVDSSKDLNSTVIKPKRRTEPCKKDQMKAEKYALLVDKITADIINGKTAPGLRKLIQKYGIQYKQARVVLDQLLDRELIQNAGRSYVLKTQAPQTTQNPQKNQKDSES